MRTIFITEQEWQLLTNNPNFHYHAKESDLRKIVSETLKCGPIYGPFKFEKQTVVSVEKRAKFLAGRA